MHVHLKLCIHECTAYMLHRSQCVFGAPLINFPQTWGEQKMPGAWKGRPAHPVLFVFAQKTNKFQFAANGMRTVQRRFAVWSTHTRIWFANHSACSCIRGSTLTPATLMSDRLHHGAICTRAKFFLGTNCILSWLQIQNWTSHFSSVHLRTPIQKGRTKNSTYNAETPTQCPQWRERGSQSKLWLRICVLYIWEPSYRKVEQNVTVAMLKSILRIHSAEGSLSKI